MLSNIFLKETFPVKVIHFSFVKFVKIIYFFSMGLSSWRYQNNNNHKSDQKIGEQWFHSNLNLFRFHWWRFRGRLLFFRYLHILQVVLKLHLQVVLKLLLQIVLKPSYSTSYVKISSTRCVKTSSSNFFYKLWSSLHFLQVVLNPSYSASCVKTSSTSCVKTSSTSCVKTSSTCCV